MVRVATTSRAQPNVLRRTMIADKIPNVGRKSFVLSLSLSKTVNPILPSSPFDICDLRLAGFLLK